MNNFKYYHYIFIFLLVLFSLNYFSAKIANSGVLKNLSYAFVLGTILISIPQFFRKAGGFIFPVQVLCFSVLFSILMAYISWNQAFSYSVSSIPYLIWFSFFYLLHQKYPIAMLERVVMVFGVAYIVLYLFQFLHSDTVYFGFREEFVEDRGIVRILFPGAGAFFLAFFIALNKSLEKNAYKWFYIGFVLMGVGVTLLQVTRQSIGLLAVIIVYHYGRKASLAMKLGMVVVFVVGLIYLQGSDIYKGLAETQKETVSEGDKYIRVIAGDYFINDFSPNWLSRIFGNGLPNNTSSYGAFTTYLEDVYGFYLSDVGIIGVYVMFGIFAVLAYISIFIKSFRMRVPENYYYLKYYTLLLLVTSLTSDAVYSINFMITNVFVLYIYQYLYESQQYYIVQQQAVAENEILQPALS
ncbi:hypothetical protein [Dyadobacter sp. CY326]|uniref:hypothetical protein n=1 Tax=Dyadobacter sp. CY326 TaxID=2907300 RepID=UPI001F1A27E4|nr:hypothetical protein [Dyadobacter sp. CY326]MCE7066591.1 hypothetical protein [Dyadobacter sp. CY326]